MRFLFCPSLILLFSLWITLISPTYSNGCSSLKLGNRDKEFSNCIELPTLKSTLHFTYNATNSSLSIAFTAAPPNANGWIAWAINPISTRMVGSQALIAFKEKGSVVVKTYNISSYSSIVEGKLSFEVWDLEAEATNDGNMVIYGALKVPASALQLNQVWQVGPGVTNGHPMKHEFGAANLGSMVELILTEQARSISASPKSCLLKSGDGSKVRKINAQIWILSLFSLLVLMGL